LKRIRPPNKTNRLLIKIRKQIISFPEEIFGGFKLEFFYNKANKKDVSLAETMYLYLRWSFFL